MIKKTRNTKSTLSLSIKLSPSQHIEAQWHRHARMTHLSFLNLITSHLWSLLTIFVLTKKSHQRCIKRCCWVPPPLYWIPSHKIKKLLFKGLGGCNLWHLLFHVATSHNLTHFSRKVETMGSMLSLGNRSEARLINYLTLLLFVGWELRGWENYNCRLSHIPYSKGHYRCYP